MECCRRFLLRRDATNRSDSRQHRCGNAVTDHHLYAQRDKRVRPHYLYSYGDSPVAEICCREPRQVVSAGFAALPLLSPEVSCPLRRFGRGTEAGELFLQLLVRKRDPPVCWSVSCRVVLCAPRDMGILLQIVWETMKRSGMELHHYTTVL
jgi:hypothetical protein